jgi:hypothetical protein
MNKNTLIIILSVAFLVIGIAVGFSLGNTDSYDDGYEQAVADIKAQQGEVAERASQQAAKAANPFQAANPLEGVSANPFEDAAKKLNPFSE